ncbi:6315_t:CDS:2 [Cetraspora pellucida]|uniref:6315_t:CDS:1 n=1 Tax=Cetraspora pellucida TaxID=1433469 RepID=A0A9N9B9L4_9GLOM|nr:6315_t:CDS:2 [Cetraspora pellucida]
MATTHYPLLYDRQPAIFILCKMDTLIPNNSVHINGGKDLEIITGIPYKIINEGHYLDNGGADYGSYVTLCGHNYDQNDSKYSRQIWYIEESTNLGEYRISSNGKYLDTFGGEHEFACRMSYENHCDSPYYSRQLWLWKFEIADYQLKAEIENFKYDEQINDLESYVTKVSSSIFTSRNQSLGSNKLGITLSEKMQNITSWSFNKSKEIAFLDKLNVDIKAEYAGVKGNLPEIINWDNKTISLETTKKVKLDETNVSGKYSVEIQKKDDVEVKIIWHKVNLDVQFTATAKIMGFSDRLRKNGSVAKMEQVDANATLSFLRNSGFDGTIIGTEGKNVLVEITGNVNIQGALKYEIEKSNVILPSLNPAGDDQIVDDHVLV